MTTFHINDITAAAPPRPPEGREFPWTVVGVFSTDKSDMPGAHWSDFCYTVGILPHELWAPSASIEGRYAGSELTGMVLNYLALGWTEGVLSLGDSVIVPLGVPDGDDQDSVWWIGDEPQSAARRQANMTPAETVIPILWSSPLGWNDDDA